MPSATTLLRSFALLLAPSLVCPLRAQDTFTRVSVDSSGAQAIYDSGPSSISGDGRFVAFASRAPNLVPGDTNGTIDAFVHDRVTGVTTRESLKTNGAQFLAIVYATVISFDGSIVAFADSAGGVYVRDRVAATTVCASTNASGRKKEAVDMAISSDGDWIAYASKFAIVPYDSNGFFDVYVYERATGIKTLVSSSAAGTLADDDSASGFLSISLSSDGRFVAFDSKATNLVPGDTNGAQDVFVRDRVLGTIERVNLDPSGNQLTTSSLIPAISGDGRYVAFCSFDSQIVPGDTNGKADIFVRDRWLGRNERVSVDSHGGEGNGHSLQARITPDGRFVAFQTMSANLLAPGLTNGCCLRDRLLGTTTALVASDGSAVFVEGLSADARDICFTSSSSILVPNDTNSLADVFVLERAPQAPLAFCTVGTSANGCVASMSATGTPSASATSSFVLSATSTDGQRSALIFYGLDNLNFTPAPWGSSSSFLCVKAPTQRTPLQNSGGTSGACDGAIALDWRAFVALNPAALGNPLAPGQQVFAQTWLRDPASAKTTALSNALSFVVLP